MRDLLTAMASGRFAPSPAVVHSGDLFILRHPRRFAFSRFLHGMRDLLTATAPGRFAPSTALVRSGDLLLLKRLRRFAFSPHA